ncbi:MAG TPA: hypothetical protein VLN73_02930, partial [Alphaproteobacteria bacterium]|nr:hypothetical protein [Alphaproteobacteria bacterium]
DYLAWAALDRRREIAGRVEPVERERAMRWRDQAIHEFLDTFQARSLESPTYPSNPETAEGLLRVFTLQKAFYEIAYEFANRPAWLSIPVRGILDLLKSIGPLS